MKWQGFLRSGGVPGLTPVNPLGFQGGRAGSGARQPSRQPPQDAQHGDPRHGAGHERGGERDRDDAGIALPADREGAEQGLDLVAGGARRARRRAGTRRARSGGAARPPPADVRPSSPRRKKRRWNSRAMKASSAPTKCSTSTTSRLPAIAPRVAKATASPVATKTRITIATADPDDGARHGREPRQPQAVVVEASRSAPPASAAPELVGIGAVAGLELQDDEPRHRQVAEVEAAAEPGLEQALGLALARIARASATPGAARASSATRVDVGLDVAPRDRPDLDRHLARDRAIAIAPRRRRRARPRRRRARRGR